MTVQVRLALTFALICFSGSAYAVKGPGECSAIVDRNARLDCFDGFFPAVGSKTSSRSEPESATITAIESRVQAESATLHNWFSITPHRPNYFIPASYNFSSDFSPYGDFGDLFSDTEIKFQISLKTPLWPNLWKGSTLWAAYTQQSYWQLYADEDASAPFRETNHEPELIWSIPVDFQVLGMRARFASLAFVHQSNGRANPLSRSWNRLTGELILEKGGFAVSAETWVRVDDPDNDNNPDIEDFMGRIQLGAAYKWDRHTLAAILKNNLDSDNRSGLEVNWTFPLAQHLKGYVQLYSGYGENLIDMEDYSNRFGIGIALTDWL